MSKEVNDKINISRELVKKQLFDGIVLFAAFIIIYTCVKFLSYDGYDLIIVLTVAFLILLSLFEYSKNAVKKPLNAIIVNATSATNDEIISIQEKNKTQKENNAISDSKIKNAQELVENLKHYSDNMKNLTGSIQEKTNTSLDFTNNEYNSVKTNIEKMFSIRHKIQTIAELILELSDFVQSISSTIGLVEDIAEQTNLLALNAAVEAARAGEHGKGFAVVASEIRKLADESKQATAKIISLINDIQQTANSTVLATEEGTKEIESGLELAHVISENIEQLINSMSEISSGMNEIITSSDKINSDTISAQEYIAEISKLVDNNRQITSETETLYEKIESTSNNLKQSVL
ncbi:MAG: hypothetical protein IJ877_07305 [Candidatus Gastranaerophilales bacterium]|nr:hypothetical protein [Candidatus Gastranaerophilales bacterium]